VGDHGTQKIGHDNTKCIVADNNKNRWQILVQLVLHMEFHTKKGHFRHRTDYQLLKIDTASLILSTSVRTRVIKTATLVVHAPKGPQEYILNGFTYKIT
jgi:hypothetical protein